MTDFHQTGVISTLHWLGMSNLENLEEELSSFADRRPIALILPSLYSELKGSALPNIIKELKEATYLREIVVALAKANQEEFRHAKRFFSALPQETSIICIDGKRIQSLFKVLAKEGLEVGLDGKGRGVWMSFGYVLTSNKSRVITLHDCDILRYNRELLARLCYPVGNPNQAHEFAKGYYSRISNNKLYGRVTRLFVTPLIRSIIKILGHIPLLDYMDSFRYPLAGEFSLTVDLASSIRIPSDWGLEVGVLAEIFRNTSLSRICQVDISSRYDHKHQPLSPDEHNKGLLKMSVDIAKSIFRTIAHEGMVLSSAFFASLQGTYLRTAQDAIRDYHDDAAINGLRFDRHEEAIAVEAFNEAIKIAAERYLTDPLGVPLIDNWNRVTSAIPDFPDRLREAVELDNKRK
ncbi:glycosyl transferase [bacterium (candidate division B38) B3_B38]|nr:MAG: glycosyl transferase [bacterium (candidate division B38) B3_B38]